MLALISGLAAGCAHVFAGPDHLAAIAPLAANQRVPSYRTGVRWGLGHASGVAFVGVLFLCLRESLPLEVISASMEHLVGVVLIGIGVWGLRKGLKLHLHVHAHSHDGTDHVHIHTHSKHSAHTPANSGEHLHTHAAFAVGTPHGFAGSSHFIGILPALAFPTRTQAIGYLVAYAIGTVIAMGSFSYTISAVATRLGSSGVPAYRNLLCMCSFASVLVGGYWLAVG